MNPIAIGARRHHDHPVRRVDDTTVNYQPVWIVSPEPFGVLQSLRILWIARIIYQLEHRRVTSSSFSADRIRHFAFSNFDSRSSNSTVCNERA
jgi:hypothetical protein